MAGDSSNVLQTLGFGFLLCLALARSDFFKSVVVEVGFHQYAELVDPTTLLKMPFNAVVNLGYVAVGYRWLHKIRKSKIPEDGMYYFDMFSMMSIIYGPVQFLRITTQQRLFAILDQWLTFPIFMWASLFGLYCLSQKKHPTSENFLLLMSILSYGLVFMSKIGFEIALGIHIVIAVLVGLLCQSKLGTRRSLKYLVYAVLCCIGFVILKINDQKLGKMHWVFKRVSGHFLSKVCDVLQIEFVACFFLEILSKNIKKK